MLGIKQQYLISSFIHLSPNTGETGSQYWITKNLNCSLEILESGNANETILCFPFQYVNSDMAFCP